MQKTNDRVLWIDGLRGIACLAIFAHHFGCCFYPVTQFGPEGQWATPASVALAQSPLAVFLNGNFWVCVFCVPVSAAQPVRAEHASAALSSSAVIFLFIVVPSLFLPVGPARPGVVVRL